MICGINNDMLRKVFSLLGKYVDRAVEFNIDIIADKVEKDISIDIFDCT